MRGRPVGEDPGGTELKHQAQRRAGKRCGFAGDGIAIHGATFQRSFKPPIWYTPKKDSNPGKFLCTIFVTLSTSLLRFLGARKFGSIKPLA